MTAPTWWAIPTLSPLETLEHRESAGGIGGLCGALYVIIILLIRFGLVVTVSAVFFANTLSALTLFRQSLSDKGLLQA